MWFLNSIKFGRLDIGDWDFDDDYLCWYKWEPAKFDFIDWDPPIP